MKLYKSLTGSGLILILCLALAACTPAVTPVTTEAPQTAPAQPVSPANTAPAAAPVQPTDTPVAVEEKPSQLVFGMSAEPDTFMPGFGITAEAAYAFELVFNSLTTKDLKGQIVGDLAKSWELSDDQLTWTFHLVDNAAWHDGRPFTAKDVVYTIEMLADPGYTGSDFTMIESIAGAREKHEGKAQSVSGMKAVDDYTVTITTSAPNSLVLETMTAAMSILPAHLLENIPVAEIANSDFARKPVGTGPYMMREWKTEEYLIFDKNPEYFAGEPNIDVFMWRVIPEPSAQVTALLNGEVDFLSVTSDDFPQVDGADGITTKTTPGTLYYNLNLHHTDPLLADVRTRQAIAHAINRDDLLIGIFAGLGSVESCIFHPSLPEYDASMTGYAYDPELAKSMLAEVGWKDTDGDGILEAHGVEGVADGTKFAVEIVTRSLPVSVRLNEMLQQYVKAVGIDATINSVEVSVYFSDYFIPGGPWQITGSRWINLIGAPQQELLWNITCDSASMFDYCNTELDEMIYANNTLFDVQERAKNFHAILDIMEKEVIYIPLIRQLDLYAYDSDLIPSDYQTVIDVYRTLPTWNWN